MRTERFVIDKLIHRGYGLGRLPEGKAVLVPYTIPGEEVIARIRDEKPSYAIGELDTIVAASARRRPPPCPYFESCGGCQLMHMEYGEQVRNKRAILEEFWRGRQPVAIGSRQPAEFGYRHRVRFQVSPGQSGIGFMRYSTNIYVDIEDCLICAPEIRAIMPWVRGSLLEKLTSLGMAVDQITIIIGNEPPPLLRLHSRQPVNASAARRLADWASVPVDLDLAGSTPPRTTLRIGPYTYVVDAGAFFQANPGVLPDLFASPAMNVPAGVHLLELYGGMGLFTVPFARQAAAITTVESEPRCRGLFQENLATNGVTNATFVLDSVEEWLGRQHRRLKHYPAIFLDPPRAGLSRRARELLREASFSPLLYLSCEVATQQRDVQHWLRDGQCRVESLILFDFFPNTFHLESLVRLHASA